MHRGTKFSCSDASMLETGAVFAMASIDPSGDEPQRELDKDKPLRPIVTSKLAC